MINSRFPRVIQLDRRLIYLLMFLAILIPIMIRSVPEIEISDQVRQAYNSIERVPQGGIVMISIDYDPSSEAELQPMLIAILHHCFQRDIKVILTGQWPLGIPLGQAALELIATQYGKVYGRDYVNIGYRPGGQALMVGIGQSGFRQYFNRDFRGTPIDSFAFMRRVANYDQIDRLVALEAGAAGDLWVQYAGAQFGLKIILGVTGVMATSMYPYLDAGQIQGLLGGLKGAAEYETLVHRPQQASWFMNSQSFGHLLIIVLVILGNLASYLERHRAQARRSTERQ